MNRFIAIAGVLAVAAPVRGQAPARVPLGAGATIVQTLSAAGGDRESVHEVRSVSDSGLHYEWRLEEVSQQGDTTRQQFRYLEAWGDLATAHRLRFFHDPKAPEAHPGYTMHALSRDLYRRLRAGTRDSMQIMSVDQAQSTVFRALGMGGGQATPVRWRGTVAPVGTGTVPFPVLLNGRRVQLPALHVRGDFTARQGRWAPEFWILADSTYPLVLKWIGAFRGAGNVLQTTRIDIPLLDVPAAGIDVRDGVLVVRREELRGGRGVNASTDNDVAAAALEGALSASCRVELPGIYFAFNSAHLAAASDRAILTIAQVLARHPDWSGTLEGHTDSIGSPTANQALSEMRVAAVRARLVERHQVNAARLRVSGWGATRPREPNATVEGRARNRRVELVRSCAKER